MGEMINGKTPEEIKQALEWMANGCPTPDMDCEECRHNKICKEITSVYTPGDALELIERLESERDAALAKVPKWISVKDRLPEKGDNVLISLCGCNVKQAVYRGDGVFEAAYADTYHSTDLGSIVLTHWMPTPKPMEVSE